MKLRIFLAVLVGGLVVWLAGCVSTLDGRTKAAVPFKKDKIQGRYERSVAQVFNAAKVVLGRLGKVNSEDTINHTLFAKVDTRNVWVKAEALDSKITQVTVQVRTKGGGADLDLAAQIEKEIALNLVNVQ